MKVINEDLLVGRQHHVHLVRTYSEQDNLPIHRKEMDTRLSRIGRHRGYRFPRALHRLVYGYSNAVSVNGTAWIWLSQTYKLFGLPIGSSVLIELGTTHHILPASAHSLHLIVEFVRNSHQHLSLELTRKIGNSLHNWQRCEPTWMDGTSKLSFSLSFSRILLYAYIELSVAYL